MSSRKDPEIPDKHPDVSRRGFIRGVGIGSAALGTIALENEAQAGQTPATGLIGPGAVPITLTVNSQTHRLNVEPRATLLEALRDQLDLTGAKASCDRGTCGSCTVLLAGKPVYACSVLAIEAQGKPIQTIESVPANDPLIAAMVRNDGTQCGFCAPGMVLAAKAFLAHHPNPDEAQVAAAMGGNLCRCGAYVPIRKAIVDASHRAKGGHNA